MFGSKPGAQRAIESLIGTKTRVDGNIAFEGGLRIDGAVCGDVRAVEGKASMLVISELARVQGAVAATHIIVNGTIEGPIIAAELLELQPKARVTGDVIYKALEMHNGAVVVGKLQHDNAPQEPRADLKVVSSNTKATELP